MKANELMIGDWVHVAHNGKASHFGKVTALLSSDAVETDIDGSLALSSSVEPIPLTDDILKRNGFDCTDPEVKQYHFVEEGERYHFSLRQMYNRKKEKDGYSFYAFNVLSLVINVHELQHAFRVCGIEKEIVI